MSNLIDTHFHLDCCKNHAQLYEQINREKQYTLCVTNTPQAFEKCINIYPETKYVKFALGYNPQVVAETKFNSFLFMKNLSKTRYIGEVGLDFSPNLVKYKEEQFKVFDFICKVATMNNKVLTVHSRKAEREVLEILKYNQVERAILHWYIGEEELVSKFIEQGCYFSVNNKMINSQKGMNIIRCIPKNRLLIESDMPFANKDKKEIETSYERIQTLISVEQIRRNFKDLLK